MAQAPLCGHNGCEVHVDLDPERWAKDWMRRSMLCRLGIHRHWRRVSTSGPSGPTLRQCVRCAHEWWPVAWGGP